MLTMHRSLPCSITCSALPADGFELRPLRDQSILEVAPQRNGQAPSQRHNADASQALATTGEASVKPLAQFTLRLVAQPTPSELHHQSTHPSVASLGNALLGFALPARVGRGREPETTCHLAPVAKVAPTKQFLRQHPAAAHPDTAQLRKPCDLRFAARGHRLALRGLDRVHLLLHQQQPLALAFDLGTHPAKAMQSNAQTEPTSEETRLGNSTPV